MLAVTGLGANFDGFGNTAPSAKQCGKQHVITVPLLVNNAPLLSSQDRVQPQEAWPPRRSGYLGLQGFPFPASCGILGLNSITTEDEGRRLLFERRRCQ